MTHMLGPKTELGWPVSTQGHAHLISGHLEAFELLALLLRILPYIMSSSWQYAMQCEAHLISGHLKAFELLALLLRVLRPPGAAACRTATLCLLLLICRC